LKSSQIGDEGWGMIVSSAMRLIKNERRLKGFNEFQRMPETAPPSALH
jgi:hypothetical protein